MGFFTDLASDAKSAPMAKAQPARQPEPEPRATAPEPQADAGKSPETVEPAKAQEAPADAGQARNDRMAGMSDRDAVALSLKRVSADTERLTRRNMKDCVSEHVQGLCRKDPTFARRVLHPNKNMGNCFRYIYRKARDFARQEMKELGEEAVGGVYGLDIPDGLCYQWAEAYFNDPDAPEDRPLPKPVPAPKTGPKEAPVKKPAQKKSKAAVEGQISLLGEGA